MSQSGEGAQGFLTAHHDLSQTARLLVLSSIKSGDQARPHVISPGSSVFCEFPKRRSKPHHIFKRAGLSVPSPVILGTGVFPSEVNGIQTCPGRSHTALNLSPSLAHTYMMQTCNFEIRRFQGSRKDMLSPVYAGRRADQNTDIKSQQDGLG